LLFSRRSLTKHPYSFPRLYCSRQASLLSTELYEADWRLRKKDRSLLGSALKIDYHGSNWLNDRCHDLGRKVIPAATEVLAEEYRFVKRVGVHGGMPQRAEQVRMDAVTRVGSPEF